MSPSNEKNQVHRPSALKQQNKPFKSGRHRSEHRIKRETKGLNQQNQLKKNFVHFFRSFRSKTLSKFETIKFPKKQAVNTVVQIQKQKLQEKQWFY